MYHNKKQKQSSLVVTSSFIPSHFELSLSSI